MKLTQKQQEKVTLGIQAALGTLIIGLSVLNSAKTQSAQMKKAAKKQAKEETRYRKKEFKQRTRLMRECYKNRIRFARKTGMLF